MIVYIAGTTGITERERRLLKIIKSRLISYWDIQQEAFGMKEAFNLIKNKNNEQTP